MLAVATGQLHDPIQIIILRETGNRGLPSHDTPQKKCPLMRAFFLSLLWQSSGLERLQPFTLRRKPNVKADAHQQQYKCEWQAGCH